MTYLIDTDWVIDHLRGMDRVTRRLAELAPQGLALSIISLAELYEGIHRSTNSARDEGSLQRFLSAITVLGVSEEICQIFGRERARLRRGGKMIGDFDLLIAATCLHHHLVLLTNNVREFERVDSLRMLRA